MSRHDPLSVLIIGTGMYVCGRGTEGLGTVLPTVVQAQREGLVGRISVAGTSADGIQQLQQKLRELNGRLKTAVAVQAYPERGARDPLAYRRALAALAKPACVIIAVPDHLHAGIAEEVIRAGCHVLVVKPLATTLADAKRLADLAETQPVYGAVEFHKRFDEANLLLRQTIADGRLGELAYVTVEYSQRRAIQEAFRSWIQHTNVFQYLGVHYVDLIAFATRARPTRVLAVGHPWERMTNGAWALDAIHTLIAWDDPATGKTFTSSITTNWIDPNRSSAMSDQAITVVGSAGRYESDQKHRGVRLVTNTGGPEDVNPYFSQIYAAATGDMLVGGYGPRSIRQFLTDVRDLTSGSRRLEELLAHRPSFREALVSTAVIEAVNRSLAQGGEWVTVNDPVLRLEPASSGVQEGAAS